MGASLTSCVTTASGKATANSKAQTMDPTSSQLRFMRSSIVIVLECPNVVVVAVRSVGKIEERFNPFFGERLAL